MMKNIFKVASKEYLDLVQNKYSLLVFILFMVFFIGSFMSFYKVASNSPTIDLFNSILSNLSFNLIYYGSIFSIIICYNSITNEKIRNSLNILITKPIYRDNILNGKILGLVCYILSIFIAVSLFYILLLTVLFGDIVAKLIPEILIMLPSTLIFSLLCSTIFIYLTMFFCILFKVNSMGLFCALIVWIIIMFIIPSIFVVMYLSSYIADFMDLDWSPLSYFIAHLSPTSMVNAPTTTDIITLLIYLIFISILSYVIFLKRDIV